MAMLYIFFSALVVTCDPTSSNSSNNYAIARKKIPLIPRVMFLVYDRKRARGRFFLSVLLLLLLLLFDVVVIFLFVLFLVDHQQLLFIINITTQRLTVGVF